MCCEVLKYRGCLIYKNISPKFGTYYWSVVNPYKHPKGQPHKECHCHLQSKKECIKVIDCLHTLRKDKYNKVSKYPLRIRNGAMKLLDMPVYSIH